jgi:predicted RecA/RadA family phage recombinase
MSTKLVHLEDHTILFTATTTARATNDAFVIGTIVGIAKVAIAAAGTGACYVRGVHSVTKQTDKNFSLGDKVFYSGTKFTQTSTSNTFAGIAFVAATTGEATGKVMLQPRP